ncbi:MAG: hypothetical protein NTV06_06045 [candidate division Zixibacteria bacterium]|nr:hypothetical protein [candidate division Zixibacteria bacterium]
MNLLTTYLPICIFLSWRILFTTVDDVKTRLLGRYKFTLLYCVALVAFTFVDLKLASYAVTTRILPMLLFILACLVLRQDIDSNRLRSFFRWTFIGMLVAYFLPNHADVARELLQDGVVFKKPVVANQYFILLEYFRNIGIFWDSRIVGIFSYLYLFLALYNGGKYKFVDIILATSVLLTSMSRGGIIVGLLLLLIYGVGTAKMSFAKRMLRFSAVSIMATIISITFYKSPLGEYIESFSVISENSAMMQREGFSQYALAAFWANPLGNGQGYLKSPIKERSVNVGDVTYDKVSDAFYAILLGEMGFIGFGLFILSILEILFHRNPYSLVLLIGFMLQLIGTDVPDMGMYYFVFLIILSRIAEKQIKSVVSERMPSVMKLAAASS